MTQRLKKKFFILALCTILLPLHLFSNQIDTLVVYSDKMQKDINNLVILPQDYSSTNKKAYPVIYLLHGHGANYKTWLGVIKKNLPELASYYNCIIVCPDGANSWYWDSPIDDKSQYETYIVEELVKAIDSRYTTIDKSEGRAITGFSMGGHGALWLTINHPDLFGACGSMSGGVDIRPFPKKWSIPEILGTYETNKQRWSDYTVITQIKRLQNKEKAIIIDCGESDFFIGVNEDLHQKMLNLGIEHTYNTSPGEHTVKYWRASIDNHLAFFSNFFNSTTHQ